MIRRLLVPAVVAAVLLTGFMFVWPPSASPETADAVVLFAGGRGERLARSLELMEEGVAPVLVISNGRAPEWDDANRLCAGRRRFEVVCPTPDPDTTRGEARMAAALAQRRGWDRVVLVTSTYHARRAGMLLRRCFDGDVDVVAARPRLGLLRTWWRAAWEWPGLAQAFIRRGC